MWLQQPFLTHTWKGLGLTHSVLQFWGRNNRGCASDDLGNGSEVVRDGPRIKLVNLPDWPWSPSQFPFISPSPAPQWVALFTCRAPLAGMNSHQSSAHSTNFVFLQTSPAARSEKDHRGAEDRKLQICHVCQLCKSHTGTYTDIACLSSKRVWWYNQ